MNFQNHEQGLAAQKTFQQQVHSLYKMFKKMGNPFLVGFPELLTLDSHTSITVYISMQNRDGDLKEFFAHEIQSFPPSQSDLF